MFWLRTADGGLVNLAGATSVSLVPGEGTIIRPQYGVQVEFPNATYRVVFIGSQDECAQFVRQLYVHMIANSHGALMDFLGESVKLAQSQARQKETDA